MIIAIPNDFIWREPWIPISDPSAKSVYRFLITEYASNDVSQVLVDELRNELCPAHPLCIANFYAAAYCKTDTDDVLYLTDQVSMPIVCVHLTWKTESKPQWPHFDSYESVDAWRQQMEIEWRAEKETR